MKLIDTILFSLSAVFFVIGIHYTITTNSFLDAYWIFMISTLFLMVYMIRKKKSSKNE